MNQDRKISEILEEGFKGYQHHFKEVMPPIVAVTIYNELAIKIIVHIDKKFWLFEDGSIIVAEKGTLLYENSNPREKIHIIMPA